jgi:hypothetical protein
LAAELVKPDQSDLIMFHHVRVAVIEKTGGDQVLWTEDGIQRRERVQFGGASAQQQPQSGEADREWQQYAKDTKDIRLLEAFKEKHKADPVYVRLAEARMEELKKQQEKITSSAAPAKPVVIAIPPAKLKKPAASAAPPTQPSTSIKSAPSSGMPPIKTSASNIVPACVTPEQLMAYLKSRNPELDPRFESIAGDYKRIGEQLGVRWDYAFYQMIVETGALSYRLLGGRAGDVMPAQNNFAGLGATGGGEHGESFKDIPTGVRAHLEHLLLYAGDRLENPTAERTRKVQEWGVLQNWKAHFQRPITFADMTEMWAPGSASYRRMLEEIAHHFQLLCAQ